MTEILDAIDRDLRRINAVPERRIRICAEMKAALKRMKQTETKGA